MKITRRQLRSLIESVILNEGPGGGRRGNKGGDDDDDGGTEDSETAATSTDVGLGSWNPDWAGDNPYGANPIKKVQSLSGKNKHIAIAQLINLFTQGDDDMEDYNSWVSGWGTDDSLVDELLKPEVLTLNDIKAAAPHYEKMIGRPMATDLTGDLAAGEINRVNLVLPGFKDWVNS